MEKKEQESSPFQVIRHNAAGIDIASMAHFVAIPQGRDEQNVRKFGSFTQDLHEMAKWLKSCGIDTIAMESTGVYWIQPYLVLEEYGFDMYLVNAREIKNVPGRKSDVKDCQWIQQLHSCGLLKKSFQPDDLIRELRTYVRQRKSLIQERSTQIQLMQKAFDQMNIKLHNVIADITGKTGMLIINAILEGERNAAVLAEMADVRIKASKEDIVKSLEGIWRQDNLFELRQAYDIYQFLGNKIAECDKQIESALIRIVETGDPGIKNTIKRGRVSPKTRLDFNATKFLYSIFGVDLTEIFGISEITVTEILSETGTDMSKWSTEKHFTSWLNLAPNLNKSGGKNLRKKRAKRKNKAGQAFMMAASTLKASHNWLGEFYRRIKAKQGAGVAVKATARKLAVIFYRMIRYRVSFTPIPIEEYGQIFKERKLKYIHKQAAMFGFQLVAQE